jgi:AraC-like DNA-binding protein
MEIETLISEIPRQDNWISYGMLIGIFQAFWLVLFILIRTSSTNPLRWLAGCLFCQAVVCFDTFLCYTGRMREVLYLNDSSEALVLCIPPFLYLFVRDLLSNKKRRPAVVMIHFLLPLLYLVSQWGYLSAPIEVKYNAYIGAYHPDLPFAESPPGMNYSYHWIKDQFHRIILASMIGYMIAFWRVLSTYSKRHPSKVGKYWFSRTTLLMMSVLILLFLGIHLLYTNDLGDHLLVLFQGGGFFLFTAFIFAESRFFQKGWILEKYESISGSNALEFSQIEAIANDPDHFENPKLNLTEFAQLLGVNTNYISQLINSETGLNFNRYLNQKRVIEAGRRLQDSRFDPYTVEGIGQSVGFHSKSSFYAAFKEQWGCSPAVYRKNQAASRRSEL